MKADLFFAPVQTDEFSLRDKTVVVVDVLRASTSIAMALSNGAKQIIPVTTVERAVKISGNLFGDMTLLGGERNGKMVEGFHLGNSPAEYTQEKVRGKSIIFSTTNGTPAMERARYAREMVVCGFINVSTVVRFLKDVNTDFIILCAGRNGMFSLEDSVCAGMVLQMLGTDRSVNLTLSDSALAATVLHKNFGKSIMKMVKNSEHGKYLAGIGFGDDLEVCAEVDGMPILPRQVGNVIRLKTEEESSTSPKTPVRT